MQTKFISTIVVVGILIISSLINLSYAGLITGNHFTDGGKVVDLSNRTWLSWDIKNISRSNIEIQMGSEGLYEKYRYATRGEIEALFDSLWGGTHEAWDESNADGIHWLHNNFGSAGWGGEGGYVIFGNDGDCSEDIDKACRGHWNLLGREGYFSNKFGLSFGLSTTNYNISEAKSGTNNWDAHALILKSSIQVPEPTTVSILALGLLGLASRRNLTQAKGL